MKRLRKILAALEPFYGWGIREVHRFDFQYPDFTDESWGPVRFFEIQWLGLHLAFEIGRTPRKLTDAEIAANCARLARDKQEA